ncbi:MAG: tyrosinase family protein [Anaerolineae bacterium]|nr:tyrosinase family protein [Gemmatimonadaceae bacterium]
MDLMKALPSADLRSWLNQAAIHGVPTNFNFCEHGTDHFFDWHRAYLFYFEKICQELTKDRKFGLPYWNWNQNPDIHPAFLDPASSLYLARSRNSMTGSWSITTAALDPILADPNFFTFRMQLEGTPHNNVHGYIGGTLGGYASARDPLFWMHHCMIDYCWAKWNIELGNNNTNDPAWVNHQNSHFVDANGQVATATAGITTLMPLISYQYESSVIGSSPAVEWKKAKHDYEKLEKKIRKGANVRFDIKQRIRIADRAAVSIGKPVSMETRVSVSDFTRILSLDPAKERVFVNIDFAQLPASSDFAVRVFIGLPSANRTTPTDDPHFAGSFAFFGGSPAKASLAAGGEHKGQDMFLVNITDTLQRLKRNQELKEGSPLSVQLVPVPFAGKFEREDTQLLLERIDIIITPVIINPPE